MTKLPTFVAASAGFKRSTMSLAASSFSSSFLYSSSLSPAAAIRSVASQISLQASFPTFTSSSSFFSCSSTSSTAASCFSRMASPTFFTLYSLRPTALSFTRSAPGGFCPLQNMSTSVWNKFKQVNGTDSVLLPRNSNQALGVAEYVLAFINSVPSSCRDAKGAGGAVKIHNEKTGVNVAEKVFEKTQLFHIDSVLCGLSALALQTNAPTLLREEALDCPSYSDREIDKKHRKDGVQCQRGRHFRVGKNAILQEQNVLSSNHSFLPSPSIDVHMMHVPQTSMAPKRKSCYCSDPSVNVVAANCAAVREWDANGTVFGYNKNREQHRAGEFGHNDFYPVVIAAAQASANKSLDGEAALKAMICLDEIRGRLAEVFSLKTYKIDHVVHGAIASAAVYGALMGASAQEIESAIGMVASHYIPWRAIRAGKQLSDSKGASAALSAEAAVLSVKRFLLCRQNIKTNGDSPFDLILAKSGSDFAVCGMHFKIGLYEHQAAGALEGLLQLLLRHPGVCIQLNQIEKIIITAYEPAVGIIGDPAKRNPQTRQSADHSMVYIIATVLRKAAEYMQQHSHAEPQHQHQKAFTSIDDAWGSLMLSPYDYSKEAIFNSTTRALMQKICFQHGGLEYDEKYPEGIPSRVTIHLRDGPTYDSGFVMFPPGHAGNNTADLKNLLKKKFRMLSNIALTPSEAQRFMERLERMRQLDNTELQTLYYFKHLKKHSPID